MALVRDLSGNGYLGVDAHVMEPNRYPYSDNDFMFNPYDGWYRHKGLLVRDPLQLPGATFSRSGGTSYEYDANGRLVPFTTNKAKLLNGVGFWSRGAVTNLVPNSGMAGATSSTLPTGYTFQAATGITQTVVGTGIDEGMPYIDWSLTGTNSSGAAVFPSLFMSTNTAVPGTAGQTLTASVFTKRLSGTWPSLISLIFNRYNAGAYLGGGGATAIPDPGAALQRTPMTYPIVDASNTHVQPVISINIPNLASINVVIRVYCPMAVLGTQPGPIIVTTGAPVTVGADVLTLPSPITTGENGVVFVGMNLQGAADGVNQERAVNLGDGSANNRIILERNSGGQLGAFGLGGGVGLPGLAYSPPVISGRAAILLRIGTGARIFRKYPDRSVDNTAIAGDWNTTVINQIQVGHDRGGSHVKNPIELIGIKRGNFSDADCLSMIQQM